MLCLYQYQRYLCFSGTISSSRRAFPSVNDRKRLTNWAQTQWNGWKQRRWRRQSKASPLIRTEYCPHTFLFHTVKKWSSAGERAPMPPAVPTDESAKSAVRGAAAWPSAYACPVTTCPTFNLAPSASVYSPTRSLCRPRRFSCNWYHRRGRAIEWPPHFSYRGRLAVRVVVTHVREHRGVRSWL